MANPKKSPFIIKLLALLTLLFGGAGIVIGLIGLFGYTSIINETLFSFQIGTEVIKISKMLPMIIISIFYFIFSLVSIGAGFSYVRGEHVSVKKTKTTAILFLILFGLHLLFGLILLNDFNMIGEDKEGIKDLLLQDSNILVSEMESELIRLKRYDINLSESIKGPDFNNTSDIVRWLITPMKVKKSDFEFYILDKIKNKEYLNFIKENYSEENNNYILKEEATNEDMDQIISILIDIGYLDERRINIIKENNLNNLSDTPSDFYMETIDKDTWNIAYALVNNILDKPDMKHVRYYINLRKYQRIDEELMEETFRRYSYQITLYDTETTIYIDGINNNDETEELPFKSITINDVGELIVDGEWFTDLAYEGSIKDTPSITDFQAIEDEDSTQYTITIIWDKELGARGIEELDIYTLSKEEGTETEGEETTEPQKEEYRRGVSSSEELINRFIVDVKENNPIHVKIDKVENKLKTNLYFEKLSVKQIKYNLKYERINLDDEKFITNEPKIYYTENMPNGLRLYILWKSEIKDPKDKEISTMSVYKDLEESEDSITKIYPRRDFMHKFEFELDRDGVYYMDVSYDKALPFTLIAYILIFVLGLLFPVTILILINTNSVKNWLKEEEIEFKGPQVLTQIAGINIMLLPLITWLSTIYIDDFAPSPHFTFNIMGIIGIIYIVLGIIGVMSGYAIMSKSRNTKTLLKTYTYGLIYLILATTIFTLITTSFTPKTLWPAVELLYNNQYPSINYFPTASHITAIFIFAGIIFSNFIIILYPFFNLRKKIKGENIKNYLNELQNSE